MLGTTVVSCLAILLSSSTGVRSVRQPHKGAECGPYPYAWVDHGEVRRVGPQRYAFRCHPHHFLASPATVRCHRGNWTSLRPPACLRIQGECEAPPSVSHAKVHGEERHLGARVKYLCDEGFVLLGHSELTCSRSGRWDPRPPQCMDEDEPLEGVAERLKNEFVTKMETYSSDAPRGRLLDSGSVRLGLELFVLLDRSSSVDPLHLEQAKEFVRFLFRRFGVRNGPRNHNGTRASVLSFGTRVEVVFGVEDEAISDPDKASEALEAVQGDGGGTNVEGALTRVLLESGSLRVGAKRALFLMTDGEPNVANPEITPQDIASQLKKHHDFELFCVGIGRGINAALLTELASEPPLSHVFLLDNYPDLEDVARILQDSPPPPPPVSRDQCGHGAEGEDRPWIVLLYLHGEDEDGGLRLCGGVLICSQWVLTAASCLLNTRNHTRIHTQDVFAVLGERHLLRDERNQTNFYVVETRLHPQYDATPRNNLALLRLHAPAARYRPACLPPTDRAIPLHQNLQTNASVEGWGSVTSSGETRARADHVTFSMHATPVSISEEGECPAHTPLCAGRGSRTCLGLEGSPLMARDPSTGLHHVIGVLSDRTRCAQGQARYAEITPHLPWINHATRGCQLKHWGLTTSDD